MAPHIQARAHRGLRRVRSRPALSVMSVTKIINGVVHTHTSSLRGDERAPKGGWRIQRCRAARDRLRRISAGERATRKG